MTMYTLSMHGSFDYHCSMFNPMMNFAKVSTRTMQLVHASCDTTLCSICKAYYVLFYIFLILVCINDTSFLDDLMFFCFPAVLFCYWYVVSGWAIHVASSPKLPPTEHQRRERGWDRRRVKISIGVVPLWAWPIIIWVEMIYRTR